MAPKKKPGAACHPSTSKAPSHAAADAAGAMEMYGCVDAAWNVVDAGVVVITSPVAEAGVGGTREGQCL